MSINRGAYPKYYVNNLPRDFYKVSKVEKFMGVRWTTSKEDAQSYAFGPDSSATRIVKQFETSIGVVYAILSAEFTKKRREFMGQVMKRKTIEDGQITSLANAADNASFNYSKSKNAFYQPKTVASKILAAEKEKKTADALLAYFQPHYLKLAYVGKCNVKGKKSKMVFSAIDKKNGKQIFMYFKRIGGSRDFKAKMINANAEQIKEMRNNYIEMADAMKEILGKIPKDVKEKRKAARHLLSRQKCGFIYVPAGTIVKGLQYDFNEWIKTIPADLRSAKIPPTQENIETITRDYTFWKNTKLPVYKRDDGNLIIYLKNQYPFPGVLGKAAFGRKLVKVGQPAAVAITHVKMPFVLNDKYFKTTTQAVYDLAGTATIGIISRMLADKARINSMSKDAKRKINDVPRDFTIKPSKKARTGK